MKEEIQKSKEIPKSKIIEEIRIILTKDGKKMLIMRAGDSPKSFNYFAFPSATEKFISLIIEYLEKKVD